MKPRKPHPKLTDREAELLIDEYMADKNEANVFVIEVAAKLRIPLKQVFRINDRRRGMTTAVWLTAKLLEDNPDGLIPQSVEAWVEHRLRST